MVNRKAVNSNFDHGNLAVVETAEMAAMTAVSAMGTLTTIDQHHQTKVLCKFEGNRRKFFGGDPGVVRTLALADPR